MMINSIIRSMIDPPPCSASSTYLAGSSFGREAGRRETQHISEKILSILSKRYFTYKTFDFTFKYLILNRHDTSTFTNPKPKPAQKTKTMTKHTPSACLASITITSSHLEGTESLEEEFRIIKKVYHEKILKEHPVRSFVAGWMHCQVFVDADIARTNRCK